MSIIRCIPICDDLKTFLIFLQHFAQEKLAPDSIGARYGRRMVEDKLPTSRPCDGRAALLARLSPLCVRSFHFRTQRAWPKIITKDSRTCLSRRRKK